MNVYEIEIEFVSGISKTIKGVNNLEQGEGDYVLTKNGYHIYIPRENVAYIGRAYDVNNEG